MLTSAMRHLNPGGWSVLALLFVFTQSVIPQENVVTHPLEVHLAEIAKVSRESNIPQTLLETGAFSYYPTYLYGDDKTKPLLVVDLACSDALFNRVVELLPEFPVLVAGFPRDPLGVSRSVEAVPQVEEYPLIVYLLDDVRTQWILGSGEALVPVWITEAVGAADPKHLSVSSVHALRLGFGKEIPSLERMLLNEYPALALGLEEDDKMDLSETVFDVAHSIPLSRPPDVNYAMVPVFGAENSPIIIREGALIVILISLFSIMLLYAHISPRRSKRYMHVIVRRLPSILFFFAVMFFSLSAANGLSRILLHRASGGISPIPLTLIKLSSSVILAATVFRFTGVRLSRSTTIYAAGSIFLLILAVLVASFISLPVSFYFDLMFVAAFLFSLAPTAATKGISFVAVLIPPVYLVAGTLGLQDPLLTTALVVPSLRFEALSAVFILPVFLMLLRLEHLTPRINLLRLVTMVTVVIFTLSAILAAIEISDTSEAYTVFDHREGRERYVIVSPQPGDAYSFRDTETGTILQIVDSVASLPATPEEERLISVESTRRVELNRTVLNLTVGTRRPAERLNIIVRSDEDILLYRADIPSSPPVGSTTTEFKFTTGAQPPLSISHSFSFVGSSTDIPLSFSIEGYFAGSSIELTEKPEFRTVQYDDSTVVTTTFTSP